MLSESILQKLFAPFRLYWAHTMLSVFLCSSYLRTPQPVAADADPSLSLLLPDALPSS